MATLELKHIGKTYEDGYEAVKDVNITVDGKEFIVLVGPSGSGKSTTLRMIAGLEESTTGELLIDGKKVNNTDPKDRNIAMVFQSYALYPHMTVRDNITFALKLSGKSKTERNELANQVANELGLEDLMDKKPGALSGGQRQRVALARAMVRDPKVFLLDEPLSNLDAKLRVATRSKISSLYQELNATFVYVTHDQTEAMTMGTRVAVMNNGKVEQFDTPVNLYYNPINQFVAAFIGSPEMNFVEGQLKRSSSEWLLAIGKHTISLPGSIGDRLSCDTGKQEISVIVGIRPEDIDYHNTDNEAMSMEIVPKRVEQIGAESMIYFNDEKNEEKEWCARLAPARPIASGGKIKVDINLKRLYLFDKQTKNTLLAPLNLEEVKG